MILFIADTIRSIWVVCKLWIPSSSNIFVKVILVYISILIVEIIVCSSLKYSYGLEFGETIEDDDEEKTGERLAEHWYLGNYVSRSTKQVFEDIFSFLVIFNNIVPISLYVTLEVQKFVGKKISTI